MEGIQLSRNVPIVGDIYTLPKRSKSEQVSNKLANQFRRVETVQDSVAAQPFRPEFAPERSSQPLEGWRDRLDAGLRVQPGECHQANTASRRC